MIKIIIGYVLINTLPIRRHEAYDELSKVLEIKELHLLFSEYDMIAKIEVDNYEEIGRIVTSKIRSIRGVLETKTLTGTEIF